MIVTSDDQDATMLGRTGQVGMFEDVATTIHTWPLPYQIPNTPSYFAPGKRLTCCVPHTEVAAKSSFTPGENNVILL